MSEDAVIVITSAIKTAFIDHPGSGHGTTWEQVTKSDEESIFLRALVFSPGLIGTNPDIYRPCGLPGSERIPLRGKRPDRSRRCDLSQPPPHRDYRPEIR